ncbi:MAG: hypothetical protein ACK5HS_01750, partial [Mycoplasmatales bacterium]
ILTKNNENLNQIFSPNNIIGFKNFENELDFIIYEFNKTLNAKGFYLLNKNDEIISIYQIEPSKNINLRDYLQVGPRINGTTNLRFLLNNFTITGFDYKICDQWEGWS